MLGDNPVILDTAPTSKYGVLEVLLVSFISDLMFVIVQRFCPFRIQKVFVLIDKVVQGMFKDSF